MTKYQRGELMEGWNDCPVPVSTLASTVSSTPAILRSRARVSRVPIVGGQQSSGDSSASSSRSLLMPPIAASPLPPLARGTPKPTVDETGAGEDVDYEKSEEKLRKLVENAAFQDKEREFFTKKLVEAYSALSAQHKVFISQVVDGIEAKQSSGVLKTQVLNYMMANNGVSSWGVPLKKLVESLK